MLQSLFVGTPQKMISNFWKPQVLVETFAAEVVRPCRSWTSTAPPCSRPDLKRAWGSGVSGVLKGYVGCIGVKKCMNRRGL